MKTIITIDNFIKGLLGTQKAEPFIKYRLSKYSIILKYKNTDLIYNTMTKQLCVLDPAEMHEILHDNIYFAGKGLDLLINNWFIVAENINEKKLQDQVLFFAKKIKSKSIISNFLILPTTDCNARCFYCFEMGNKRLNMNIQTAEDVAKYMIRVSNGKNINIRWFGGEPLLNPMAIDTICAFLLEHGIQFRSKMTTNGFLFNDNNIKKSKTLWNLKSVQVTLDGTEKIYNKAKAYIYRDIVNPFKIVYENIGKLLENNIRTIIRLNMDMHNVNDLYHLIDMVHRDYGNYDNLKIYPAILFENIGADHLRRTDIQRKAVYSAFIGMCDYLFKKDILAVSPLENGIKTHRCMADSDEWEQIMPTGNIGKCEHYVDGEFIGSIYSDKKDFDLIESWKVKCEQINYCTECSLYPICFKLKKCRNGELDECVDEERQKELFFLKASIKKCYDLWINGKLNLSKE